MRADILMESQGELHRKVKRYANENAVQMPRAYAELIEAGLAATDDEAAATDTAGGSHRTDGGGGPIGDFGSCSGGGGD